MFERNHLIAFVGAAALASIVVNKATTNGPTDWSNVLGKSLAQSILGLAVFALALSLIKKAA